MSYLNLCRSCGCDFASVSAFDRHRTGVYIIDLQDRPEAEVLDILTTLETCVTAHEIPSARVELDGLRHRTRARDLAEQR